MHDVRRHEVFPLLEVGLRQLAHLWHWASEVAIPVEYVRDRSCCYCEPQLGPNVRTCAETLVPPFLHKLNNLLFRGVRKDLLAAADVVLVLWH